MAEDCPTCRVIRSLMMAGGVPPSQATQLSESEFVRATDRKVKRKVKRKVSAYQKEFGRQLKALKRKHPRTSVTKLMKRAHGATRRKRKGSR